MHRADGLYSTSLRQFVITQMSKRVEKQGKQRVCFNIRYVVILRGKRQLAVITQPLDTITVI